MIQALTAQEARHEELTPRLIVDQSYVDEQMIWAASRTWTGGGLCS